MAALLMTQCGHHRYPSQLIRLDTLSESHPDSAVSLMQRLAPTMSKASEWDRHYYELLSVKVADKAGLTLPSDTMAWQMVAWFEENGDSRLLPTAYYYAARICRTLNDAPQALDYMLKANDLLGSDDAQLHLKAVVNSQMGYLFSQQKLYKNAIDAFNEAFRCDSLLSDTTGIIYDLMEVGFNLENVHRRDSSIIFMEKAMALAQSRKDEEMIYLLEPQMANIYRLLGRMEDARVTIKKAIDYNDEGNQSAVYSIAADIYKSSGMLDSALFCYRKLICLPSIYAQRAGYRGLSDYYSRQNDYRQAHFFFSKYKDCSDSIDVITATNSIAQMNSLYSYRLRENESVKLRMERDESRQALQIIIAIIILLIFSFLVSLLYFRYKDLSLKIKLERRKMVETAIELAELNSRERLSIEEKLLNTDIVKKIRMILNDPSNVNKVLCEDEWEELEHSILLYYPDFKDRIIEVCKLTSFKLHLCLLLKAKFVISEIALLTQHSAEAITSARRRMAQKAFGESCSPIDWDKFIKSL